MSLLGKWCERTRVLKAEFRKILEWKGGRPRLLRHSVQSFAQLICISTQSQEVSHPSSFSQTRKLRTGTGQLFAAEHTERDLWGGVRNPAWVRLIPKPHFPRLHCTSLWGWEVEGYFTPKYRIPCPFPPPKWHQGPGSLGKAHGLLVQRPLCTTSQQMATTCSLEFLWQSWGELSPSPGTSVTDLVCLRCLLYKLINSLSCSFFKQLDFLYVLKCCILTQLTCTLSLHVIWRSYQTFLGLGEKKAHFLPPSNF